MLKIGQFSKQALTTIKTLRYYEQEKLLLPAYIDKFTGYRYYETSQLMELNKIILLRQLGLSIEDIKDIKAGAPLKSYLEKRSMVLEKEISASNIQLTRINLILDNKESELMNHEVILKNIPEYIVYYKEGVLNKFQDVGEFVVQTGIEVTKANPTLKCVEPGYCFMEYLDGEYRESNIKARYSEVVEKVGNETDKIKFKKLPKVTVASIYHRGTYENLRDTYAYILNWIEEHGYEMTDLIRESYIDGIWNKDDVNEWLTEIQVPIKK